MKTHLLLKFVLITFLLATVPALVARAQYPVTDVVAQTLLSQGNANFLQQMATEFAKLDTQISNLKAIQSQGQQVLTLMGNPAQALSFAAGSMGLNPLALTGSGSFQSMQSIANTANGGRSLLNTSGGIFQSIPTTTPNGQQIIRNPEAYKKFDAFEQDLENFQSVLTQAQTQRQDLLSQLQTVMSSTASTEADQSEKISRINALAAQLHANDEVVRDANEQRQAQNEANAQDGEKQKQAKQDELNTEFQQTQTQADQQWSNALSSVLNQKP